MLPFKTLSAPKLCIKCGSSRLLKVPSPTKLWNTSKSRLTSTTALAEACKPCSTESLRTRRRLLTPRNSQTTTTWSWTTPTFSTRIANSSKLTTACRKRAATQTSVTKATSSLWKTSLSFSSELRKYLSLGRPFRLESGEGPKKKSNLRCRKGSICFPLRSQFRSKRPTTGFARLLSSKNLTTRAGRCKKYQSNGLSPFPSTKCSERVCLTSPKSSKSRPAILSTPPTRGRTT